MQTAWLSLGANIGDPPAQLREAVEKLDAHDRIAVMKRSAIIRTKPWGKTDQPDFANMAVEIATSLDPVALLTMCLATEKAMGRERIEIWGPRLIDIDIVAIDRQVLDLPKLKVPHPFAHERSFVLDPLREISPETAAWLVDRRSGR